MGRHSSKEYRVWREGVVDRDKMCVICGTKERLHAHHIEDYSYHPDSRYLLSNGVTLCSGCHINFHTNFKRSYRQKCTRYDWDNFTVLSSYFLNKK